MKDSLAYRERPSSGMETEQPFRTALLPRAETSESGQGCGQGTAAQLDGLARIGIAILGKAGSEEGTGIVGQQILRETVPGQPEDGSVHPRRVGVVHEKNGAQLVAERRRCRDGDDEKPPHRHIHGQAEELLGEMAEGLRNPQEEAGSPRRGEAGREGLASGLLGQREKGLEPSRGRKNQGRTGERHMNALLRVVVALSLPLPGGIAAQSERGPAVGIGARNTASKAGPAPARGPRPRASVVVRSSSGARARPSAAGRRAGARSLAVAPSMRR